MLAVAYLALFLLCGAGITFLLLPRVRFVARIWLGLCLGLLMMMWLPALTAFLCRFTVSAHLFALLPLGAIMCAAWLLRDKRAPLPFDAAEKRLCLLLLAVSLPLTVLTAYLHCTHTLSPAPNGTLHVGQSTYGDLPLHLAIVTSMRGAAFPADYSILPGTLLSYPFLTDTLSTSFMLMGFSLRAAILAPGILMSALVFCGYVILAERIAGKCKTAALAALFFFINGGLGFFYLMDMQGTVLGYSGHNELQAVAGLGARIRAVLSGWYQTPANHAEFTTYNLRWSNVIVDMMVPQRTTLGGWCMTIPCVYLLYDMLWPAMAARGVTITAAPDGPTAVFHKRALNFRSLTLAGIWAGALPMVNTHCFLALGLMCAGFMLYDLIVNRAQISRALCFWAVFGAPAVLLAAPQLFTWTFRQSLNNQGFLRLQFNWVNGENGMLLDNYFWFYLKNIGLPFALILLALLEKNPKRRFLASGAFAIYIVAEFVVFTPNTYDNNKLFYIWYMLCAVIAADYALELLGRLRGLRARPVIAALCAFACFATGTLSIARECVSDYQMFSAAEVAAAKYVEAETPEDATFLTSTTHINFVSSLAGRKIVCGPDTWLYFHGLDTSVRQSDIRAFYADPAGSANIMEKYDVDYILVGGSERSMYAVNLPALSQTFECVYTSDNGQIMIFKAGKTP